MDLRQLECFLEVAEQLHFGRAAQRLHLGQPTVSETIRRLEREVGGALFDRTTRRVTLTPLGLTFLEDARVAYEGVRRAYERARMLAEQQALEFDLGYSGDLGEALLDLVPALQRHVPGVVVNFRALTTPRQVQQVRDGRLHAAIGWSPEHDPQLEYVPLGLARLVAVVPSQHELAARPEVTLAELAHEPLIGWPRSVNPVSYDRFARAMDDTGVPWTLVGTAAGPDNVAGRVLSGFGVGISFGSFVELRPLEGVRYVPVVDEHLAIERVLFWRRDARHPALEPFVTLAEKRLRD